MVLLAVDVGSFAYDRFDEYTDYAAKCAAAKRIRLYAAYIGDFCDYVRSPQSLGGLAPVGEIGKPHQPYDFEEWYAMEYCPKRQEMENRYFKILGAPGVA